MVFLPPSGDPVQCPHLGKHGSICQRETNTHYPRPHLEKREIEELRKKMLLMNGQAASHPISDKIIRISTQDFQRSYIAHCSTKVHSKEVASNEGKLFTIGSSSYLFRMECWPGWNDGWPLIRSPNW